MCRLVDLQISRFVDMQECRLFYTIIYRRNTINSGETWECGNKRKIKGREEDLYAGNNDQ